MKLKCEFCKIWLPLILIFVAGFYIAWQFVPPAAPNKLRIATGSKDGTYYQYAQIYKKNLQKEGIHLDVQTTAGSVEALQLLREGKVDIAFIQGGISQGAPTDKDLHSIASLFYEPLWVFTRNTTENKTACTLQKLQGKRLAIGVEGSGTHALVSRLLKDSGIDERNSKLLNIKHEDAASQLEAGEIDAAFFVSSPKSETINKLIAHPDIAIMNFQEHADAYTRHYRFLDALDLGKGALNLKANVPSKDTTLLVATAALVVAPDVHANNVRLLTREALRIHHKPGLLEEAWQFPSRHHLEIPIHPDAAHYLENGPSILEKYLPFSVAARLDQLKIMLIPLLTLLLPLAKGMMPLYKWRIRSRTYRWYKNINQIDRELEDYNLPQTQHAIDAMQKLHGELAQDVSVPLSYMSEFYTLRIHTDHILTRLHNREKVLQTTATLEIPEDDTPSNSQPPAIANTQTSHTSSNEPSKQETLPLQNTAEETRLKQANKLLSKHVATGATLSTIPIPMLDIATLISTQLNLLHSLSDHYGIDFDRKRGKSIVVSMLSGSLPTTMIMGLSSMSKFIPGIGTLGGGASVATLSGAILYATGKVFIKHFEAGGTLDNFDSKQQRRNVQTLLKKDAVAEKTE